MHHFNSGCYIICSSRRVQRDVFKLRRSLFAATPNRPANHWQKTVEHKFAWNIDVQNDELQKTSTNKIKERTTRKKSSCAGKAKIEQRLQHVYDRNSCTHIQTSREGRRFQITHGHLPAIAYNAKAGSPRQTSPCNQKSKRCNNFH